MTEVDVGTITARLQLDTTGLKRGQQDSTTALPKVEQAMARTGQAADKLQRQVDTATGSIKRNAQATVEANRQVRSAEGETRRSRASVGGRSGATSGAASGAIVGTLISQGISSLGDGKGGTRDTLSSIGGLTLAGGAIGSVGGPVGTALGAGAGAAIGVGKNIDKITGPSDDTLRRLAEAEELTRKNQALDASAAREAGRRRLASDNLGQALVRQAQGEKTLIQARKDLYDPQARQREAGLVAPLIGGSFDEPAKKTKGDPVKAADKLAAANNRVAAAQARVDKIAEGGGGASRSSVLNAQAAVLSAEDALRTKGGNRQAELLRLQAAESRLADLRRGGSVDTRKLAAAESSLEDARKRASRAQKDAEDAGSAKTLNTDVLLERLKSKEGQVRSLDHNTRTLIKKGLTAPVIEELLKTEAEAPGTVSRLASTITRAQVRSFNHAQKGVDDAAARLIKDPLDAAARDAAKAATANAALVADATRKAYANAFNGGIEANLPAPNLPGKRPGAEVPNDPLGTVFPKLGSTASQITTFNLPNATIVASNPAQLAQALKQRERLAALAGGHGV